MTYDPLGRRIAKTFDNKVTKYIWDGNNIIHEWVEVNQGQPPQNIQTWLFEDGTFTPFAKLTENKSYAVVTDHLGSPKELINQNGKVAWKATLDMYGMVRSQAGGTTTDSKCNFRFPGQYEDEETGLCYNRFRYYMPSEGMYTQRDPIGLAGGNPTVYGYTWNSLTQVDPFGLGIFHRSMSIDEYFNTIANGWGGVSGTMKAKWFADNFDHAIIWGQRMGHGSHNKFYILSIHMPDHVTPLTIAPGRFDEIGPARTFSPEQLNDNATIHELNSVRVDTTIRKLGEYSG